MLVVTIRCYLTYCLLIERCLKKSTEFSPFGLMYGWKIRGPLKEVWSGSVSGSQNVVSHVVKMIERLVSMTDLVREKIM